MLARELKKLNLVKQKEFIKEQLQQLRDTEDGNVVYTYAGHLFPEVIAYFREEGFHVNLVKNDRLLAATRGVQVYYFYVDDDVELDKDELETLEEDSKEDVKALEESSKEEKESGQDEAEEQLEEILQGLGSIAKGFLNAILDSIEEDTDTGEDEAEEDTNEDGTKKDTDTDEDNDK